MPRTGSGRSRATIEDVAAAAGVSVATVSRALRGLPNVAESTRTRVRSAADSLAYRPDPAASRLAAGDSRTVAVVVPILGAWYFSQVIAGAAAVLTDAGYDLLVMGVPGDAERRHLLDAGHSLAQRADGLIFVDVYLAREEEELLAERHIEVVTIGSRTEHYPAIRIDDVEAGRLAGAHLIGLGHRRIGLVTGESEDPPHYDPPRLRRAGFEQAMAAAGLTLDEALVVNGHFSIDGGWEAMRVLLGRRRPPTAVFAMSDEMAFGAIRAARELGVAIPESLSIVGVDGHELSPVVGLTTVHQSVVDHGAEAARLLLGALQRGGRRSSGVTEHPVHLVVRETTAPPARAHRRRASGA